MDIIIAMHQQVNLFVDFQAAVNAIMMIDQEVFPMMFLGTGASESIPNPLCRCPVCTDARTISGYARCRSMFLLDSRNLIDFGPDLFPACHKLSLDLGDLESVFITHTHGDHFCLENMDVVKYSMTRDGRPLTFYLSAAAYDLCIHAMESSPRLPGIRNLVKAVNLGNAKLVKVVPYQWFETSGLRVMAVESSHTVTAEEHAINYLFEKEGKRFLYACDSGRYLPQALEALRGAQVDALAMDCTWGLCQKYDSTRHLNCEDFCLQLKQFEQYGILGCKTQVYATHVNHKQGATHAQLQHWFDGNSPFPVTVAMDGMRVELQ